jgi:competence protein ComEA
MKKNKYPLVVFNLSEKISLSLYAAIIVLLISAPYVKPLWITFVNPPTYPMDVTPEIMDILSPQTETPVSLKDWLTPFDPNTVSENTLIQSGLSAKMAGRFIRFRDKYPIYSMHDIGRIYGIDSQWLNQIEPFIQINTQALPKPSNSFGSNHHHPKYPSNPPKPSVTNHPAGTVVREDRLNKTTTTPKISVNTAGMLEWMEIKGIGAASAHRIMQYREKLGGFVHHNQLLEIYGIDTAAIKQHFHLMDIQSDHIRKININTDSASSLYHHPYISYNMAKLIVYYRKHHGDFKQIEDLRPLHSLSQEDIDRLTPYLKYR